MPPKFTDDYDEVDWLIDHAPIELGNRCRKAEYAVMELQDLLREIIWSEGGNYVEVNEGWLQLDSSFIELSPTQYRNLVGLRGVDAI